MKRINIETTVKRMLADVFTPVGLYLRLRDRFRDTLLLESADFNKADQSFSFICVNAVAGIEIRDAGTIELKYPGNKEMKMPIDKKKPVPGLLWEYMQGYDVLPVSQKEAAFAQGLFGYTGYDAVQLFDTVKINTGKNEEGSIPLMRYRLYQYVIVFDHFHDDLLICENHIAGIESEGELLQSLIGNTDIPVFPFGIEGDEEAEISDEAYRNLVSQGVQHCLLGDVFQVVLSRKFSQAFSGDEFTVYRALRSINPSQYLFYFDYGDYRLMGSSPEAQLQIKKGEAVLHPIAGTVKRTGDDALDQEAADKLSKDEKENAEHVMLVDLARNDLSRVCEQVEVTAYREVQYYSHVIHLVSKVKGVLPEAFNPFTVLAESFPAGTLSGAPKYRAMELIGELEKSARGYYGGAIGFMGFNGDCNHAIMIRTLLSKNNRLYYQAGAGVVAASDPGKELEEVHHKLGAIRKAMGIPGSSLR